MYLTFEVPIEHSSWVAMRILGSSHTNPIFVLVQGKNGASAAAALAAPYHRLASSELGTDRYLALWSREDEPSSPQHDLSSSPGP